MNWMSTFAQKELSYFRRLTPDARRMLWSFMLESIAGLMLGGFINAFLWRQEQDVALLVVYNAAFFFALSFGFYINGFLLKFFSVNKLYWFGCILQNLVPFVIVVLTVSNIFAIGVLGFILGIAGGFYWGNRNFITLRQTESEHRLYFSSLESVFGTLITIVVPVCIGWLIVLGERWGWYTATTAYRVIAVFSFVVTMLAGSFIQKISNTYKKLECVHLRHSGSIWNRMRFLEVVNGFQDGIEGIMKPLLILLFIGLEESLGTIQSASAILAMVAIYVIGRRMQKKTRHKLLGVWVGSAILGGLFLGWSISAVSLFAFFALSALTADIRWTALSPIMFDVVDHEEEKHPENHHYAYLFDREIYLNAGRLFGLLVFFVLYLYYPHLTLRFLLLGTGLVQIVMYFLAKALNRTVGAGTEDVMPLTKDPETV